MCQATARLAQILDFDAASSTGVSGARLALAEPHTLISGTAFAQSLYCARKALFADRFRATGSNLAMTVGRVAHELFQVALEQRPVKLSKAWLFRLWRRRFLPTVCMDLVGMHCSLERFEEELSPYLDNIATWIRTHIMGPDPKPIAHLKPSPLSTLKDDGGDSDSSEGGKAGEANEFVDFGRGKNAGKQMAEPVYFNATRDIEENVWTPTLGMKGRIDVSFLASSSPPSHSGDDGIGILPKSTRRRRQRNQLVMPLELKTGKSYGNGVSSIEHHSQVLIYSLMLAERANDGRIGPGFLLYLRDNAVVEVRPRALELRGLLQMRNRLASKHFSRFTLDSFPAPLKDPRMCRLCPFSALCGALSSSLRVTDEQQQQQIGDDNKNGDGDGSGRAATTTTAKKGQEKEQYSISNNVEEDEIVWLLDSSSSNESSAVAQGGTTGNGTTKKRRRCNSDAGDNDGNKENVPPQHFGHEAAETDEDSETGALTPEMRAFLTASTAHLSDAEVAYGRRCIRRTLAQWAEADQRGSTRKLFSNSPAERERLGICFANMELLSTSTTTGSTSNNGAPVADDLLMSTPNTILLRFKKASNTNGIFSYSSGTTTTSMARHVLEPGAVVTVSTDHAYALLIGTIVSVDVFDCSVTLRSDKNLPTNFEQEQQQQQLLLLYHLDKHDGFSSFALRLGSIAALLANDDERTRRLRSVLTHGHSSLTSMSSSSSPSNCLSTKPGTADENAQQHDDNEHHGEDVQIVDAPAAAKLENDADGTMAAAVAETFLGGDDPMKEPVRRVLNTPDFAIAMGHDRKEIFAFLATLSRTLLRMNKSVLFCANSNAAVDELLQLLVADHSIPDEQLLRIGRRQAVRPGIEHLLLDTKMAVPGGDPAKLDADEVAKAFYCRTKQLAQQKPLFVACPLASVPSSVFLSAASFDFCLVDEASQFADAELIAPLLIADRFALCTAHKNPSTNFSLLGRLIQMTSSTSNPAGAAANARRRRLITLGGGGAPTRQPMQQIDTSSTPLFNLPAKKAAAETPPGSMPKKKEQQTVKRRRTMTLFDFWKK